MAFWIGLQILILGASSVLIEWLVLSLYVIVTSHAGAAFGPRWGGVLERVGGGSLVAAGARLALLRIR